MCGISWRQPDELPNLWARWQHSTTISFSSETVKCQSQEILTLNAMSKLLGGPHIVAIVPSGPQHSCRNTHAAKSILKFWGASEVELRYGVDRKNESAPHLVKTDISHFSRDLHYVHSVRKYGQFSTEREWNYTSKLPTSWKRFQSM